jgi:CRP-like cAMP-binding protein
VTRSPRPTTQPKNKILLQLTPSERHTLLAEAECIRIPAGGTLARPGDEIASIFFPDAGVISVVSEMATGHQVAVAVVGREGLLGVGALLSVRSYTQRLVAVVESHGVRICADRFRSVFECSAPLRRATLHTLGRGFVELTTVAACNRVHSHRQRLARWLLLITDKAGQRSLRITHESLAQMVGGPRHAVTVALNDLRGDGAITYRRGSIDIGKRSVLMAQACECYRARP